MNRNSKSKGLVFALILTLVLGALAGCGEKKLTPDQAVDAFLKSVKESDKEAMKKVYEGEPFALSELSNEVGDSEIDLDEKTVKELEQKMFDFDYTIDKSTVKEDGDNASVVVKFKTNNMGKVFTEWFGDYMAWAIKNMASNRSEEEATEKGKELLVEKIGSVKKDFETEVRVKLVKKDGDWVVKELDQDSELVNALTGDMLKSVKEMTDAFSIQDE